MKHGIRNSGHERSARNGYKTTKLIIHNQSTTQSTLTSRGINHPINHHRRGDPSIPVRLQYINFNHDNQSPLVGYCCLTFELTGAPFCRCWTRRQTSQRILCLSSEISSSKHKQLHFPYRGSRMLSRRIFCGGSKDVKRKNSKLNRL